MCTTEFAYCTLQVVTLQTEQLLQLSSCKYWICQLFLVKLQSSDSYWTLATEDQGGRELGPGYQSIMDWTMAVEVGRPGNRARVRPGTRSH